MKISRDRTIEDLKREFRDAYPGLKLEFYSKAHKQHEGSSQEFLLSNNQLLKDIISNEGEVELEEDLTVGEMERTFAEKFNLHVQVFRKSRSLWLQTSKTDDWTLAVQNRKGIHSEQV